jgi:hypothetical protein
VAGPFVVKTMPLVGRSTCRMSRSHPILAATLTLLAVAIAGAAPAPQASSSGKTVPPTGSVAEAPAHDAAPKDLRVAEPEAVELEPLDLRTPSRVAPTPGHNTPARLGRPDQPRRVESKAADRGALATSLHYLETPLRQPSGFSEIFLVPGSGTRLMRSNGAVHAVFSDSVYQVHVRDHHEVYDNIHYPMGRRELSQLPPGVVFYLGPVPTEQLVAPLGEKQHVAAQSAAGSPDLVQPDRIDPYAPPEPGPTACRVAPIDPRTQAILDSRRIGPDGEPAAPVSILNHSAYRAERIRQLMRYAAKAAQSRSPALLDLPDAYAPPPLR